MNLPSVLEDERISALISSQQSESFNSTPASPSRQTLLALRLDRSGSSKARCLSAVDSSWCSLAQAGVWRGWNAPNPMIRQSSNLVPTVSAHTVASNMPFGS